MTEKKIKTPEELIEEARLETETYGLTREANLGLYALTVTLGGISKISAQKEALKSPEQKAREKAASAMAEAKRQQDKALKEHERKSSLYAKWCKHDTWLVQSEAFYLLLGQDPSKATIFDAPDKEISELIKSCVGHSLSVTNPKESPAKWRVTPSEWVRWVKDKGFAVPHELTDLLFPKLPVKPSIAKAQESREQKKRDRQRYLKTFAFEIAQLAKTKGLPWDSLAIPVTKAEFLDGFYDQYPQIGKISKATFDHDIAEIGLKFKAGTKPNPDNVLARITK